MDYLNLAILALLFLVACDTEDHKTMEPISSKAREAIVEKELPLPEKIDFNFHVKPILSDRCFKCHGPDKNKIEGDLSLATEEQAFSSLGDHFAIIPFKSDSSTLVTRVFSSNPDDIMPPPESNLDLSDREKEILKKWVDQGATWEKHWSLIPPSSPSIPTNTSDWDKNEIDAFVLYKLESLNLSPNVPATKEKLLRRLSFDLTGLPPSLDELDEFLQDTSKTAIESQIDRLLSSEAYGEHMGSIWLDIARYSDTNGNQADRERTAWPWRDWVIHAFNKNLSYDQFISWQLAGDLLPNRSKEQLVATTFNRNHSIYHDVYGEEYRVEYVKDRTHTFGTAFLGMTLACAQCHDHKYDPISQKEYYQLYSYFNNFTERPAQYFDRTPQPFTTITKSEIKKILNFIKQIDTIDQIELMIAEERDIPRQSYVLQGGASDRPSIPVEANTPEAILPIPNSKKNNRKNLVEWLFKKDHPLTSRVAVNRFWYQFFGAGIVGTLDDFGSQGALPSHPELLDFLALKFQKEGWDIKKLLKYIVSSATYQQSTYCDEEKYQLDPENKWLGRMNSLRLESEKIRDHALFISGLLVQDIGGPSVKPYQPEGLWKEVRGAEKYVPDIGKSRYRRSLYSYWKRNVPPPNMLILDASSRDICTVKRQKTNTPLQALVLMNDPQFLEATTHLAYSVIENVPTDLSERISTMFRLATSRAPLQEELDQLIEFYKSELSFFEEQPEKAKAFLSTATKIPSYSITEQEMATYALIANAIFNLDESISKG